MADCAQPVSPRLGIGAAVLVAALIFGTLAAVALRAEPGRGLGSSDWAALRFTLIQACLSAGLSVALAIPVARALARRRFMGRRVMIALLGAPFILPVIVAILGLLQVFGRAGWISDGLSLFGLEPVQIYGLHGVVLAHVFFNLPLATRLILQGWQEIPAERFRLAAQLGADARDMRRLLEYPLLRRIVPGALAVVFALEPPEFSFESRTNFSNLALESSSAFLSSSLSSFPFIASASFKHLTAPIKLPCLRNASAKRVYPFAKVGFSLVHLAASASISFQFFFIWWHADRLE